MKKANSNPVTAAQAAELQALAALPDDKIDTRALQEQRDWSDARCGVFFRPVKQQLTLRLDADIIDWFRTHTPWYDQDPYARRQGLSDRYQQRFARVCRPARAAPSALTEAAPRRWQMTEITWTNRPGRVEV